MRAMRAMRGLLWRGARAAARLLGSVRVRLTLWYLLILAIVFLVFGAVVYTTTRSEAASAERASLAAEAQQLLGAYDASDGRLHVTDPWANGQIAPAKARFGAGYPLDRQDVAVLIGPNGEVAQSLGPVTPGAVAALRTWQETLTAKATGSGQPALTGLVETLALDVREAKPLAPDAASASVSLPPIEQSVTAAYAATLVEVHSGGQHAGWLVIATPSQANRTLSALVPGLLIAGPLTLLIAALGGYWLAARAMRPMRLITRAAREIGETDLSRRLRVKRRDELGELAATFDGMLARLEAAFARQRQLTADASHELRTPLAIVGLEAERALARRREPEEYERALTVIQAENAHMARLVDDLLTLARADAGQPAPARMEPLDLSDLALETVERLAPLARDRGVALVTGELPEVIVRGDRGSLARMLANLVENGIKYTAGQGTRVAIATGTAQRMDGAWAWARIEDDGPGIPAEHLPHLFERFYRADAARGDDQSDGSGLGLAIARWAVEAHGGHIPAENLPTGGARFEVWLPLPAHAPAGAS